MASQEQINLYWWFGQQIYESQEKYGWGKSIVEKLAKDLSRVFPDSTYGFSPRNLWDMRRFYLEYKDYPNLRQLVAEIPWGQHLVILNKVKDPKIKELILQQKTRQSELR
jgi:predicted nuclease of restriction endonuclease-like (RecB) superfamily